MFSNFEIKILLKIKEKKNKIDEKLKTFHRKSNEKELKKKM